MDQVISRSASLSLLAIIFNSNSFVIFICLALCMLLLIHGFGLICSSNCLIFVFILLKF
ncbi:hypothetical protein RhiirC2_355930 [Rhizophagus irregularis]|uniref:Uncharacterized protein n=1 Tax=Rhizophagus irregularis TaxID=588596 RepID=A0A2N1M8F4_9GLOM|nr:hypothetical protein RhiirC2_355930 [Rhizophagus irregularis]